MFGFELYGSRLQARVKIQGCVFASACESFTPLNTDLQKIATILDPSNSSLVGCSYKDFSSSTLLL